MELLHTLADHYTASIREREAYYILCPASSLMDVPGYVNPDKLMNVPIEFVCSVWLLFYLQVAEAD